MFQTILSHSALYRLGKGRFNEMATVCNCMFVFPLFLVLIIDGYWFLIISWKDKAVEYITKKDLNAEEKYPKKTLRHL